MFGHRVVEDFVAGFELERGPSFFRELGTVRSALRGCVRRGGFGIFHLHIRRRRWVSSWSAARSSSRPFLPPPLPFLRSLTWSSRSRVMSSAWLSFLARARARVVVSAHVCARSPIRLDVESNRDGDPIQGLGEFLLRRGTGRFDPEVDRPGHLRFRPEGEREVPSNRSDGCEEVTWTVEIHRTVSDTVRTEGVRVRIREERTRWVRSGEASEAKRRGSARRAPWRRRARFDGARNEEEERRKCSRTPGSWKETTDAEGGRWLGRVGAFEAGGAVSIDGKTCVRCMKLTHPSFPLGTERCKLWAEEETTDAAFSERAPDWKMLEPKARWIGRHLSKPCV